MFRAFTLGVAKGFLGVLFVVVVIAAVGEALR